MLVLILFAFSGVLAYPILESGQILIGESSQIQCEKGSKHEIQFMNFYKTYTPQVILTLQNYTNEIFFADYSMELHIDLVEINTQKFTFELTCSKVKSAVFSWYAFGGDTYDSGCFPLQYQASVTLEQVYAHPMDHAVFISGFAGLFKYGATRPALSVFSTFDNKTITIQVESNFQLTYVCYLLSQDMTSATLNETEVSTLIEKKTQLDDTIIMGIEQFAMLGNSFQFQLLNDKMFFPKLVEMTIKVVKFYEPIYRKCPRVYQECNYEGEPVFVCEEEVQLNNVWKEFRSLKLFDQKIKFKLNIANKDNILWLADDIDCSYDMYDQLMEMKIKNEPLQKEMLKKRKMLNMLYQDEEDDNILIGQQY